MTTTNPSPQKITSPSNSSVIAGPWTAPTLETNVDDLLQAAAEHWGQKKAHEIEYKAIMQKLEEAHAAGLLADYYEIDKPTQINYLGWQFNRKTKTSKVWAAEAKKMIEKVEYTANRMGLYSEKKTEYWECRQQKK
jgi:hypothetical protein